MVITIPMHIIVNNALKDVILVKERLIYAIFVQLLESILLYVNVLWDILKTQISNVKHVIQLVLIAINMVVFLVLEIELDLFMENVNVIHKVSADTALDQSIVLTVLLEFLILP